MISISAAEEGEMPLAKFVEILMVERRSFADQEQWDSENLCGLEMVLTHDLESLKQNSALPTKADETTLALLRKFTDVVVLASTLPNLRTLSVCSPDGAVISLEFLVKVIQGAEPGSLLERALSAGQRSMLQGEALIEEVCDQIVIFAVCDVLKETTCTVSIETGAHLGFSVDRTVAKIEKLVKNLEENGFQRDRVLFELGCTWEATRAAALLEGRGIHCSLSLVFSFCQAAAAADAGASLILIPFRQKSEWWQYDNGDKIANESHPGVLLLLQICSYLRFTSSKTRVGGTALQSVDEVLAIAGCDTIIVTPGLLEELRVRPGPVACHLGPNLKDPDVDVIGSFSLQGEAAFRMQLNANALATEKLAQGIRESQRYMDQLRQMVKEKVQGMETPGKSGST